MSTYQRWHWEESRASKKLKEDQYWVVLIPGKGVAMVVMNSGGLC